MSTGLASQRVTNAHPRQRGEPFVEGLQDLRRIRGAALRRWRASLASRRFGGVANILLVGDSMSEHYGATSEYNRWPFLFRAAIQRMFRLGGVGWIPAKHTSGWLYTTNPDGKNAWTLTGLGDNNDYGFGLGRHNAYLAQAGTATITVDTDRFFLFFTTGGGSGTVTTIDVDPGTAFAKTTTVNTNQAWGQSGFLFDSNTAFGPLPLGTHVVKVTATTGATFFDGGFFCYTDGIAGVHLWECDHAGFTSMEFDGASDTHSYWADFMWQPPTSDVSEFADGVGNGTTTFTSATANFVATDVGAYLVFPSSMAAGTKPLYGVAKIVSRNSSTSVVLDRVVPSGGTLRFRIARSFLLGTASITSGSPTLTAAGANFTQADVGCFVTGPTGIPANTRIQSVESTTSCTMSHLATATQSSQTVRILNRQALDLIPDLLIVEFGINERVNAFTPAMFKGYLKALVSYAQERGASDRPAASVVLMPLWAIGTTATQAGYADAQITSGQPTLISDTADFGPEDVGKSISGTGIAGGATISSVQSNRQITMSANATSTTTTTVVIANRAWQDRHWQLQRQTMWEVADEMGWEVFDLYSLGGWIGPDDPNGLTYDEIHPSNRGGQWVADELNQVLVGLPEQATIPQGIMDAAGDLIVGAGADLAAKIPAGVDGQMPVWRAAAKANGIGLTVGLATEDASSSSSLAQVIPQPGVAGITTFGLAAAPTQTTTPTSADDGESPWQQYATSAVLLNATGIISAFTVCRMGWLPEFFARVKTDPTAITSLQYVIGLVSASPDANPPGTGIQGAYFRYNTTSDGTAAWRTCTCDGSFVRLATTAQPIAANTSYRLRIVPVGVVGSTPTSVRFYINDVLVSEHTLNIPAATQQLGYAARVMTLTAGAKNLKLGRLALSGP